MITSVVFGALVAIAQPVSADPENNFATISRLDAGAERSLGVFSQPDSLKEIAQINTISILATEGAPDRLAAINEAAEDLPAIFFEFPPKAIILSDSGLGLLPAGLATARASGAYIVLGDGFFSTKGVRGIPVSERPRVLMHEWVHVLQYYYADLSRPGPFSLETHSTLLDGWPEATGWEQVDGEWRLPDAHHGETTNYGRTAPLEDQADAFALILVGQPDRVSQSRVTFMESALGRSVDEFTAGVFAQPPGFLPLRKVTRRLEGMLDDMVPNGPGAQLWIAEDVADAEALFGDYAAELERRGFETVANRLSAEDSRGVQTYFGEWRYDGKTSLVGAIIMKRAGQSIIALRAVNAAE